MRSLRPVSRPGFTRANCRGFCPPINCYSGPGARQEVRRIAFVREHVRHHGRFYLSALLGAIVWAVTGMLAQPLRFLVAGDAFFGVYLALTMILEIGVTPETLRTRATAADEGIILIVVITLTAICFSLASIFALLNQNDKPDAARLVLAIVSVPLGWLMLHTIAAFHYAHLYYARAALGGLKRQDAGGLKFPDTDEPTVWDFLYYSFVVGMTAQVSDVQVLTTPMRRLTLAHGIASFFFNTVLLALAVNVAVVQIHR